MKGLSRIEFKLHDVRGDGHCFFRSIAQAMSSEDEDRTIQELRGVTAAEFLRRKKKSSTMLTDTLALCYGSVGIDCFLSSTTLDFIVRAKRPVTIETYAQVLEKTNAFASFIEVDMMTRFLRNRGIALIVVPSMASLASAKDWEMRLKRIVKRKHRPTERLIILLNHDGVHYSWVSVGDEAIVPWSRLIY